jgi:anti-anti-sigma factor
VTDVDMAMDLEREGLAVITLRGELDIAAMDILRAAGESALEHVGDGGRIQVDLGRVTFLDSSGLSTLVRLRANAAKRDIALVLRGLQGPAARVFQITGLVDVFTIEE